MLPLGITIQRPPAQRSLSNLLEQEAHLELERLNKKCIACISAQFIRTFYILSRDSTTRTHPRSVDNRIVNFYQCGSLPEEGVSPLPSVQHRLRLSMFTAIPWLFSRQHNQSLDPYVALLVPTINQEPINLQPINLHPISPATSPFFRRNLLALGLSFSPPPLRPLSLERALYNVLKDLPSLIIASLEDDLTSVKQILSNDSQNLPPFGRDANSGIYLHPFYEQLVKISCISLIFIRYTSHFFNNNLFDPFSNFNHLLNAQETALDMISAVSHSLLYIDRPQQALSPQRHPYLYINSCIVLSLLNLSTEIRDDLRQILPHDLRDLLDEPVLRSGFHSMQPSSTTF